MPDESYASMGKTGSSSFGPAACKPVGESTRAFEFVAAQRRTRGCGGRMCLASMQRGPGRFSGDHHGSQPRLPGSGAPPVGTHGVPTQRESRGLRLLIRPVVCRLYIPQPPLGFTTLYVRSGSDIAHRRSAQTRAPSLERRVTIEAPLSSSAPQIPWCVTSASEHA